MINLIPANSHTLWLWIARLLSDTAGMLWGFEFGPNPTSPDITLYHQGNVHTKSPIIWCADFRGSQFEGREVFSFFF